MLHLLDVPGHVSCGPRQLKTMLSLCSYLSSSNSMAYSAVMSSKCPEHYKN